MDSITHESILCKNVTYMFCVAGVMYAVKNEPCQKLNLRYYYKLILVSLEYIQI